MRVGLPNVKDLFDLHSEAVHCLGIFMTLVTTEGDRSGEATDG